MSLRTGWYQHVKGRFWLHKGKCRMIKRPWFGPLRCGTVLLAAAAGEGCRARAVHKCMTLCQCCPQSAMHVNERALQPRCAERAATFRDSEGGMRTE
jgi:hypothetical protein